ncbi:chromosome condensation regulator RCC1 [Myxococcus sp. CA040A]|nr:chromosome condensation regulator RCC1 [Myxococcus sp. CA040A]NTX05516.1 chromosome condensation regulator RCC1 [Myxococcus sp. CA040A]
MKRRVGLLVLLLASTSACLDPIRSTTAEDCDEDVAACPDTDTEQRGLARQVSVGSQHACALLETGGVRCWGGVGLVGDGTRALRAQAVDVRGLGSGVLALAVGGQHTCVVVEGGTVRCWGDNSLAQLGNNTTMAALEPVDVPGAGTNAVTVVSGLGHSCSLHAGGQVMCWGENNLFQLGGAYAGKAPRPVPVLGLPANLTVLASGANHTCAATADGEAWCWGDNTYGALGNGLANPTPEPGAVRVRGLSGPVRALTAGLSHTCARVGMGDLECWGFNREGQLGDDTALDSVTPVRPVGLSSTMRQVRAGNSFTCALDAEGRVRCWGLNGDGQLGDGTRIHRAAPVEVTALGDDVVDLSAGATSTCAVMRDGQVRCWGANALGQLGDGTQSDRVEPAVVQGLGAP